MILISSNDIGKYTISKSFEEERLDNLEYDSNIMNSFTQNTNMFITELDEYPYSIQRKVELPNHVILNTNRKILKVFLRSRVRNGCSDKTIDNYKVHLSIFLYEVIKPINEITSIDIYNYLDKYRLSHNISNNTLDNIRRVINSFFEYLEQEDVILKSPCRKIHKIKGDYVIKTPFSEEEIESIRDICPSIRELALVDFLNSSGVRVNECSKLNKEDISLSTREGIVFGKGGKERVIYFDARAKLHLERYLAERTDNLPALFVSSAKPYRRLSKHGIEYVIAELGKCAGVTSAYPHRFRRTLATRLIEKGTPIEQVQRILGHSKLETTLIYARVNQYDVKRNHERYSS